MTAANATKGKSQLLKAGGGSFQRYYPYVPNDEIEAARYQLLFSAGLGRWKDPWRFLRFSAFINANGLWIIRYAVTNEGTSRDSKLGQAVPS